MRHRFWKSRLLNYTVPDTSGYDILLLIQTLQLWILCYSLGAELVLPQLHRGASLISSTLLNQYVFPFLWFFILLLLHFPLIPNLFLFSPWFFPLRSLSSLQPAQFLHFLRLCEFYLCNSSLFPSLTLPTITFLVAEAVFPSPKPLTQCLAMSEGDRKAILISLQTFPGDGISHQIELCFLIWCLKIKDSTCRGIYKERHVGSWPL